MSSVFVVMLVCEKKKKTRMMCQISSDLTYVSMTKVFCLGDNDDDDDERT